jgi:hypothetical protein
MTDFALADQLCCGRGVIVFDDALYPAIETVINYISSNRPDYVVVNRIARNCSVAQKIGPDRREWFSFKPFSVPTRCDWTSADSQEDKPITIDPKEGAP